MSRCLGVLLVAAVVAACGGGGGDEDGGQDGGDRPAGRVGELLDLLPDLDGPRGLVALSDVERAAEIIGVEAPEPGAPPEAVADYRLAVTSADEGLLAPAQFSAFAEETPGELRQELGFAFEDVLAIAEVGERPAAVTVFRGRFDRDSIDATVAAEPVWSDLLATDNVGDARIWSWGEDGEVDPARVTPGRPTGEAIRLALDGDRLARSFVSSVLLSTVAGWSGAEPTLAGVAPLTRLTEVLDARGAVSALLSDDVGPLSIGSLVEPPAELPVGVIPLLPYTAFGVATTRDGDEPVLLVALTHADDAAAATNADRLRDAVAQGRSVVAQRPWSELLGEVTVDVEGTTVVLEAHPRNASLWAQLVLATDSLLAHQ